MKIAFISDIHANIFALKKVIDDIEKQNDIEEIICLGDLVGSFIYPNKVVNFIRKKEILTIQGEFDELIGDNYFSFKIPEELDVNSKTTIHWTRKIISKNNKEWLKSLPKNHYLNINNQELLLVHGSPQGNTNYLYPDREQLIEKLAEYKFDLLVCGHTHEAYYENVGKRHVANAGSVGSNGKTATYIILDIKKDSIDYYKQELRYNLKESLNEPSSAKENNINI